MSPSVSDDWIEITPRDITSVGNPNSLENDPDDDLLNESMQRTARAYLERHPADPIFRVKLGSTRKEHNSILQVFIDHVPDHRRRQFRCRTCKQFMRNWGTLVCVDSVTGDMIPLFWDSNGDIPLVFKDSVDAVIDLLKRHSISELYISSSNGEMAGTVDSGGFTHMHFDFNRYMEKRVGNDTAGLTPASTSTRVEMLDRVLRENDKNTVERTADLLLEDKLLYSHNHKDAIRWLQALYDPDRFSGKNEASRRNLLWYFAAIAFSGCIDSLRNGMVGKLLEMVQHDYDFQWITASWNHLADPLKYLRPKAAPKASSIAAIEKLFAELNLTADDMRRAFSIPDQIPLSAFLYKQSPPASTTTGIFCSVEPRISHGTSSSRNTDNIPVTSITFAKFVSKVLPTAEKIQYKLPGIEKLFFFITGLPNTAPLMQWHDATNLASWFSHAPPIAVSNYKLRAGWVQVPYIVSIPHMWVVLPCSEWLTAEKGRLTTSRRLPSSRAMDSFKHKRHGIRYIVGLQGIADYKTAGRCLFPHLLRSEMHGVRATIEAYSNQGNIE